MEPFAVLPVSRQTQAIPDLRAPSALTLGDSCKSTPVHQWQEVDFEVGLLTVGIGDGARGCRPAGVRGRRDRSRVAALSQHRPPSRQERARSIYFGIEVQRDAILQG